MNRFLGLTGAAEALGVSKQRVLQLEQSGVMPEPDGLVDGSRRIWDEKTLKKWARKRKADVAKLSKTKTR